MYRILVELCRNVFCCSVMTLSTAIFSNRRYKSRVSKEIVQHFLELSNWKKIPPYITYSVCICIFTTCQNFLIWIVYHQPKTMSFVKPWCNRNYAHQQHWYQSNQLLYQSLNFHCWVEKGGHQNYAQFSDRVIALKNNYIINNFKKCGKLKFY